MQENKPHYITLDGLRGVAALLVIAYHVFECFDLSPAPHGYLAVDFFFVLSGFVIGYAYDDRWQRGLTLRQFAQRRLIRLHPMVVVGAIVGAIAYLAQGCVRWDGTSVSVGWVMVAMLMGMVMLPLWPGASADVRGNGELFPLNGPSWSLFFEYIGNVLYALLLRRLSTKWLAAVSAATGLLLVHAAMSEGYLGVGWTMAGGGLWLGLVRMLFPYSVGMLMARRFRPWRVSGGLWLCGLAILAVGCVPAFSPGIPLWASGLFDALCVVVLFPLLVWVGASDVKASPLSVSVSQQIGALSYPLYAIHYPLMYLFYAHIGYDGNLVPIARMQSAWPAAIAVVAGSIIGAWLCLHFIDQPLRQWLTRRVNAPRRKPSRKA